MFRGYLHEMFRDPEEDEDILDDRKNADDNDADNIDAENADDIQIEDAEANDGDSEKKSKSQGYNSVSNAGKHGILKNQTCVDLLIGSAIFLVVGEIIILLFTRDKLYETIGFFEGVAISVGMILHMTVSLEQAMCMNSKGAYMHVRKTAAIRLTVVIILLIVIGYFDIGSIVAVLIGTFALKVSAYLQPFTHKALAKKRDCSINE